MLIVRKTGVRFPAGTTNFLTITPSRSVQIESGARFLRVERPGHEANVDYFFLISVPSKDDVEIKCVVEVICEKWSMKEKLKLFLCLTN
jgi:hypothetical protein